MSEPSTDNVEFVDLPDQSNEELAAELIEAHDEAGNSSRLETDGIKVVDELDPQTESTDEVAVDEPTAEDSVDSDSESEPNPEAKKGLFGKLGDLRSPQRSEKAAEEAPEINDVEIIPEEGPELDTDSTEFTPVEGPTGDREEEPANERGPRKMNKKLMRLKKYRDAAAAE